MTQTLADQIVDAVARAQKLIEGKRQRQINAEGYSVDHDDHHKPAELANAALAYARCTDPDTPMPEYWPWESCWWKPKGRIRNFERAGALFLAAADLAVRRGCDKEAAHYRDCAEGVAYDLGRLLIPGGDRDPMLRMLMIPPRAMRKRITVMASLIFVIVAIEICQALFGDPNERASHIVLLGVFFVVVAIAGFNARRLGRMRASPSSQHP